MSFGWSDSKGPRSVLYVPKKMTKQTKLVGKVHGCKMKRETTISGVNWLDIIEHTSLAIQRSRSIVTERHPNIPKTLVKLITNN